MQHPLPAVESEKVKKSDHPGRIEGRVDGVHLGRAATLAACRLDDLERRTVR